MGSVKNIIIEKEPTCAHFGVGKFIFSDRYSVFDWGEMPDLITNKGKALCIIGAYFFEKLEKAGIKTHYRGLVENDEVKPLAALTKPTDIMQVDILRVIKPKIINGKYNYSYTPNDKNILIPLEIIYRNTLGEGSSIFKRLADGIIQLEDINLTEPPIPGQMLSEPIFELSTKLEAIDKYISWDEAKSIACLTSKEIADIKDMVAEVNKLISNEACRMNLENSDGKIELGFDKDRNIIIIDVVGTPDECRFISLEDKKTAVSKEMAREYYRSSCWYKEVIVAKKKDTINWKQYVQTSPSPLPAQLLNLISNTYQEFCNNLTGRDWFNESE